MKYIGWLLFFITAGIGIFIYINTAKRYKKIIEEKDKEINMWIEKVKILEKDTVKTVENVDRSKSLIVSIQSDKIFTDYISNDLTVFGKDTLSKVINSIDSIEGEILIGVHTDDLPIGKNLRGRFPTNWELSAFRAAKIAKFFMKEGISSNRIIAAGFANSQPVDEGKTGEARKKNRRVEISIIK